MKRPIYLANTPDTPTGWDLPLIKTDNVYIYFYSDARRIVLSEYKTPPVEVIKSTISITRKEWWLSAISEFKRKFKIK